MIRYLGKTLRRFRRREDGVASVEFAIIFPAYIFLLMAVFETSFIVLRHAALERAVDQVVRDIRLGTGSAFEHDQIKDEICAKTNNMIDDCDRFLRLEMLLQDPRVGVQLDATPDCTDKAEEGNPDIVFQNGQSNQLMILRACAMITPIFAKVGLGKLLADNNNGQFPLTSTTAFVQEPL